MSGLLGTNMTWETIEMVMQKACGTVAKFGEKKMVTNIGDKKGMLSRICLIEPDWINTTSSENLPQKFVVKIPSTLPSEEMSKHVKLNGRLFRVMLKMISIRNIQIMMKLRKQKTLSKKEKLAATIEMLKMFHNREVEVYTILTNQHHPLLPHTKVYAATKFDDDNTTDAYLITDYIPDVHFVPIYESYTVNDLIPAIKWAATYSAVGEKLPAEQLDFAKGRDFMDICFNDMMDVSMMQVVNMMFKAFLPAEKKELAEKVLDIVGRFYISPVMFAKFNELCKFLGFKPVLIHGDMHTQNLITIKKGDRFEIQTVIDYQTTSLSHPAQDLGKLICSCLSKMDRRANTDQLIRTYYDTFVEQLDGREVPYTFEQLVDNYNLIFPFMGLMLIIASTMHLLMLPMSEEEREMAMEKGMDKVDGLMEDVVEMHERNIRKFPQFFEDAPTTEEINGKHHVVAGHTFQAVTLLKPSYCSQCTKFIYGMTKQGYTCQNCNKVVHKKCHKDVIEHCTPLNQ